MSKRDWGSNIAIGGLVAITFAVCVAIASNYVRKNDQAKDATYASSNEELSPGGSDVKNRRPAADSSICRQAKSEKEYEVCQAWRAANAAKEAADTAYRQYLVSIGGLLGLILTVIYTGIAAREAGKAARAATASANVANRTLKHMKGSGEQRLRAYVCLESGSAELIGQAPHQRIDASSIFRNSGQTPGYHVMTWSRVVVDDIDAMPFTIPPTASERPNDPRSIIGPNSYIRLGAVSVLVTAEEVNAIAVGRKAVFYWGRVDYVDAFEGYRFFNFRCRMTGPARHDLVPNQTFPAWGLMAHPSGYQAN